MGRVWVAITVQDDWKERLGARSLNFRPCQPDDPIHRIHILILLDRTRMSWPLLAITAKGS